MINKLQRFLEGILVVLLFLLVARIITTVAVIFMPAGALDSENTISTAQEIINVYYVGQVYLVEYLLDHAFYEELFFRFLPLIFLARWQYRNQQMRCDTSSFRTVFVVAVSSVIFGWLHGGFWNIFVQGVYGVAFAAVFIMAANNVPGPFGRMTRSVFGLWAATCIHAFSNYAIIFSALH